MGMNNKNEKPEITNQDKSSNNRIKSFSEENLVKDLKDSLKSTIDETQQTLDMFVKTVEASIKDESVHYETTKIVSLISNQLTMSITEGLDKISTTIEITKRGIDSEEE
jgi:predicted transcriptional regulator